MLASLQRNPAKRITKRLITRSRPYLRVYHQYHRLSRLRLHMTPRTRPSYRLYLCIKVPQETRRRRLNLENPRFIYLTVKESLLKMYHLLTCLLLWKWAVAFRLIKTMLALRFQGKRKRVNQNNLWETVSAFLDSSEATNLRDLKFLQVVSDISNV